MKHADLGGEGRKLLRCELRAVVGDKLFGKTVASEHLSKFPGGAGRGCGIHHGDFDVFRVIIYEEVGCNFLPWKGREGCREKRLGVLFSLANTRRAAFDVCLKFRTEAGPPDRMVRTLSTFRNTLVPVMKLLERCEVKSSWYGDARTVQKHVVVCESQVAP